jgi:hypothetical protein
MRFFNFFKKKTQEYEIDEAEFGIGSQKIRIKPNYEDLQIAYRLWIELTTRKIGLTIDPENDVIFEVYNSWYEFFKIARNLIKNIPIRKIRKHQSTREIIELSIKILNVGLRPHLTKWQAKFRKWYDIEIKNKENIKLSPQQIQRKYPEYNDLIKEIQDVNRRLINYKDMLRKIAFNK